MNWKPIETAPRPDVGRASDDFLCVMHYGHGMAPTFGVGYTSNRCEANVVVARDSTGEKFKPTHWMPLPEPPGGDEVTDEYARAFRDGWLACKRGDAEPPTPPAPAVVRDETPTVKGDAIAAITLAKNEAYARGFADGQKDARIGMGVVLAAQGVNRD